MDVGAGLGALPEQGTPERPRLDGADFSQVVVQSGDSMSQIAIRKYGQASTTILDLLKLANPELEDIDRIVVGQSVRLPQLSRGFPVLDKGDGEFALLVFSAAQPGRASALSDALRGHGFNARVERGSVGQRKPVHRVVLTGFGSRDEVGDVGKRLQQLFRSDTQLAQLGQ